MMTMTMMMIMVTMTMMENAHIRKGSSLITFTLATPATVTGTPWMMVDVDDDVDDDGDDHDGDVNDDVDDDADDVDNDGDDDDDDPCIPAVTGSPQIHFCDIRRTKTFSDKDPENVDDHSDLTGHNIFADRLH